MPEQAAIAKLERLSFGMLWRKQPITSSKGRSVLLLNSTITASSAGQSTVLVGWLGPMGASVVVVRERHFVTVVRLSP